MPENEKEIIISNGSAAFWNSTDPLGQTATFTVMKNSDMTIVQTVKGEDAVITATESYEAEFVIVGTFEVGDTIRVAQLVNDEMMQIRELTIGAVLESTPWFAPEKSHGFILVPIETIDNYFEQGTLPTNLYTTGMMSIRVDPEQLPAMQDTLYERSVAAFGALNGFVFNSL